MKKHGAVELSDPPPYAPAHDRIPVPKSPEPIQPHRQRKGKGPPDEPTRDVKGEEHRLARKPHGATSTRAGHGTRRWPKAIQRVLKYPCARGIERRHPAGPETALNIR